MICSNETKLFNNLDHRNKSCFPLWGKSTFFLSSKAAKKNLGEKKNNLFSSFPHHRKFKLIIKANIPRSKEVF